MTKRIAILLASCLLLALGACSNIKIRHNDGTCPPGDRNVQLHAGIFRPEVISPDGERRPGGSVEHEGEIHFEAWSPEPGFTGLTIGPMMGSDMVNVNQLDVSVPPGQGPGAGATVPVDLPWDGTACWGVEHPAGLLMQVRIPDLSPAAQLQPADGGGIQVLDQLECFMEEGDTRVRDDTDFIAQDSLQFDITDLIPGARQLVAHCVGIYTPQDWAGAPVDGGPPHP